MRCKNCGMDEEAFAVFSKINALPEPRQTEVIHFARWLLDNIEAVATFQEAHDKNFNQLLFAMSQRHNLKIAQGASHATHTG